MTTERHLRLIEQLKRAEARYNRLMAGPYCRQLHRAALFYERVSAELDRFALANVSPASPAE